MKSNLPKKNKGKKFVRKNETDLMIEHVKEEIRKDTRHTEWLEENLSSYKAKIAQNRKILKKLSKHK